MYDRIIRPSSARAEKPPPGERPTLLIITSTRYSPRNPPHPQSPFRSRASTCPVPGVSSPSSSDGFTVVVYFCFFVKINGVVKRMYPSVERKRGVFEIQSLLYPFRIGIEVRTLAARWCTRLRETPALVFTVHSPIYILRRTCRRIVGELVEETSRFVFV